jgi:5-methylcytosine-specific restriction endonuclease McrA
MSEHEAYAKLYNTKVWKANRRQQLEREPLCYLCLMLGKTVAATVANHKVPHKGDWELFADPDNLESVCKLHHDALIQKQERRGYVVGSDCDGRPRDPDHPWNVARRQTGGAS